MKEFEIPDWMYYPTFNLDPEGWRVFPDMNLPSNYQELVPLFYEQGGKEEVEKYAKDLEDVCQNRPFGVTEMHLRWDDLEGLTSISLSTHSGLDLSNDRLPHFKEHNIGFETGIIGGMIIMKYISELLKSE